MKQTIIMIVIGLLLSLSSCNRPTDPQDGNRQPADSLLIKQEGRQNAVYYWKTVFDPDSIELAFLCSHNITRMYIRYFDVIYDPTHAPESLVPNATIQFKQSVPDGIEVIPTIFITNEAMANWPVERMLDSKSDEYYYDQLLYRIQAMNQRNGIKGVREVQVDCDWSVSTRYKFFMFCEGLKSRLRNRGLCLSSTIRLHQLKEPLPPVDRGVLMCYNTGSLRNISAQNSILSESDVYSYIRHLEITEESIPIDIAYPTFAWSVMFAPDRRFLGIVRKNDLSDTEYFRKVEDNLYEVIKETTSGNAILKKGNLLRLEQSDYCTIKSIKGQLDTKFAHAGTAPNIILYHLDSNNLSKYSHEEIESLYQ